MRKNAVRSQNNWYIRKYDAHKNILRQKMSEVPFQNNWIYENITLALAGMLKKKFRVTSGRWWGYWADLLLKRVSILNKINGSCSQMKSYHREEGIRQIWRIQTGKERLANFSQKSSNEKCPMSHGKSRLFEVDSTRTSWGENVK